MLTLLTALALLAPQGPSEKDLFDEVLASVRSTQAADGHYGNGVEDTANVVIAMALSPRAYRVDDGPFLRDAVQWLLAHHDAAAGADLDARVALALSRAHAHLYGPTVDAILARHAWQRENLLQLALGGTEPRGAADILAAIHPEAGIGAAAAAAARAAIVRTLAQKPKAAPPDVQAIYERGVDFLLAQRSADGTWEMLGYPEPGLTAIAVKSLLGSERPAVRESAIPTLDWLVSLQQEDGSIHGGRVQVYTTSAAIGALRAGGREQDLPVIARAVEYLQAVQCDDGENYSESDKFYGGIGYGNDLRPDLSNLQYALEAMHEAGVGPEDPAFQRAIFFLQRSQNRRETNTEVYLDADDVKPIRSGDDGGAVYYPGNSFAGVRAMPDGTRIAASYGSMTYALLKCYAFAGLEGTDPRVAAAVEWISAHWTLEVNPGFDMLKDPRAAYQGLYYYYETLAEALAALKLDEVVATGGVRHDWRAELAATLRTAQKADGSWVNEAAERWWEGNPVLCTGYALNALLAARK
jgi:squalene-hopene/tetraprenyl-beta-curcumene cyclase